MLTGWNWEVTVNGQVRPAIGAADDLGRALAQAREALLHTPYMPAPSASTEIIVKLHPCWEYRA